MTKNSNQNLLAKFIGQLPSDRSSVLLRTQTGDTYTYGDALKESAKLARCLNLLGARPGDRVTVQIEKSPAAVWLYLACLRGGFIFHPLNTDYQRDELRFFVDDAEPAVVVCDPGKRALYEELNASSRFKLVTLNAAGAGELSTAAQSHPDDYPVYPCSGEDTAVLLYSSGTTGLPKGAMLSHANLAANTFTLVECWGFNRQDCLLHALPIYHAHGLFVALGCVLASGCSMRFLARFDAQEVIRNMAECTVMMGVPTFYTRLLDRPEFCAETCEHMRLFISGSAPLLAETFASFESRTGHTILERYGMTETSMNSSNPLHGERRMGSVGLPLPGVELRTVTDSGAPTPRGEIGHLQVRGPNVFSGYWRMPEKTSEEFTSDGFFVTGDEAIIEADGYVSIVGRAKDMIISGGLNVYPREIEQILDAIPEILESAVIGAPHPDFGEGVIALIVAEPDSNPAGSAVMEEIRPRLAAFKRPKKVFVVAELPRNAMGKVQKNLLRQQYENTFSDQ